jgi:hypothetical protein
MNTPHERLTRTTFSLPLGEVHALVGDAVNARPLLFLHGFPDHPPTAVPFLEHLAETHRVVAPWLRGYAAALSTCKKIRLSWSQRIAPDEDPKQHRAGSLRGLIAASLVLPHRPPLTPAKLSAILHLGLGPQCDMFSHWRSDISRDSLPVFRNFIESLGYSHVLRISHIFTSCVSTT